MYIPLVSEADRATGGDGDIDGDGATAVGALVGGVPGALIGNYAGNGGTAENAVNSIPSVQFVNGAWRQMPSAVALGGIGNALGMGGGQDVKLPPINTARAYVGVGNGLDYDPYKFNQDAAQVKSANQVNLQQPMQYMQGVASGATKGAAQTYSDYMMGENKNTANAVAASGRGGTNAGLAQRGASEGALAANGKVAAALAPTIAQERQAANQSLYQMGVQQQDYETKLRTLSLAYQQMGLSAAQANQQAYIALRGQDMGIAMNNVNQQNENSRMIIGGLFNAGAAMAGAG